MSLAECHIDVLYQINLYCSSVYKAYIYISDSLLDLWLFTPSLVEQSSQSKWAFVISLQDCDYLKAKYCTAIITVQNVCFTLTEDCKQRVATHHHRMLRLVFIRLLVICMGKPRTGWTTGWTTRQINCRYTFLLWTCHMVTPCIVGGGGGEEGGE